MGYKKFSKIGHKKFSKACSSALAKHNECVNPANLTKFNNLMIIKNYRAILLSPSWNPYLDTSSQIADKDMVSFVAS